MKILSAFSLVVVVSLLACGFSQVAIADSQTTWNLATSSEFYFNGDNATITAYGPTSVVALVTITSANNTTLYTQYLQPNAQGRASVNYTIPFNEKSGVCHVTLIAQGAEVANTSFEIIYLDSIYYEHLWQLGNQAINDMKKRVSALNTIVNYDVTLRTQIFFLLIGVCLLAFVAVAAVMLMLKDVGEYVFGKRLDKAGFSKIAHSVVHLPMKGVYGTWMHHVPQNVSKARKDKLEEILGRYDVKVFMVERTENGEIVKDEVSLNDLTDYIVEIADKEYVRESVKKKKVARFKLSIPFAKKKDEESG